MRSRQELRQYKKEWRLRNLVRLRRLAREYYHKNRKVRDAANKEWRLKNPEAFKAIQARSKKKNREKSRAWVKKNPAKVFAYKMRRVGLSFTLEQFNELKARQNNRCAICKKKKELMVDHCHETMQVRGLLCNNCNVAIGHFFENIESIKNSINYLWKS